MFTGLIEEIGTVKDIIRGPKSAKLVIRAQTVLEDARLGDSIAVNGACLTVINLTAQTFTVQVMEESLKKTTLGELVKRDQVNLERALQVGGRLGGHLVSGHIDGVGLITEQQAIDIALLTKISVPPQIRPYLVEKGSVAIDGVSLTVVQVGEDWFSVSIIPHTAEKTTLGQKVSGQRVNLESDLLGKYVWKMLEARDNPVTSERINFAFLEKHGFV
ncbi:MAG TPA: riboflavin synthase [Clostridia bacterium]|nr:riboflavin synthase [Clostridia bacterium]